MLMNGKSCLIPLVFHGSFKVRIKYNVRRFYSIHGKNNMHPGMIQSGGLQSKEVVNNNNSTENNSHPDLSALTVHDSSSLIVISFVVSGLV